MADPTLDPNMIDEDLEDGEIETDEEAEETKQPISSASSEVAKEPPVKKIKTSDEEKNVKIERKTEKNPTNNSKKATSTDPAGKFPYFINSFITNENSIYRN